MNWIDEVSVKLKKNNQILFSKNSEYMQDLIMLFEAENHRVMALWAFDFASESIAKLEEKYPEEKIGYPIYDLTAIIYKYGIENCKDVVEQRKQEYIEKILYWNEHLCDYQGTWADFMLK